MRQIAIYGKGITGKSTLMQNWTVSILTMGNKILLARCYSKADFTRMLLGGLNQRELPKNPV